VPRSSTRVPAPPARARAPVDHQRLENGRSERSTGTRSACPAPTRATSRTPRSGAGARGVRRPRRARDPLHLELSANHSGQRSPVSRRRHGRGARRSASTSPARAGRRRVEGDLNVKSISGHDRVPLSRDRCAGPGCGSRCGRRRRPSDPRRAALPLDEQRPLPGFGNEAGDSRTRRRHLSALPPACGQDHVAGEDRKRGELGEVRPA